MNQKRLQLATFFVSIAVAVLFFVAVILYLLLSVLEVEFLAGVMAGLMLFLAVCWVLNFILIVHTLLWNQMSQDEASLKVDSNDR